MNQAHLLAASYSEYLGTQTHRHNYIPPFSCGGGYDYDDEHTHTHKEKKMAPVCCSTTKKMYMKRFLPPNLHVHTYFNRKCCFLTFLLYLPFLLFLNFFFLIILFRYHEDNSIGAIPSRIDFIFFAFCRIL